MKFSEIHAQGCTVAWKKPLDDGGAAISHYVVEKMDKERGTWIPCGEFPETTGKVIGLSEGHDYKFRIKAVNIYGESLPCVGTDSVVAKNPYGWYLTITYSVLHITRIIMKCSSANNVLHLNQIQS